MLPAKPVNNHFIVILTSTSLPYKKAYVDMQQKESHKLNCIQIWKKIMKPIGQRNEPQRINKHKKIFESTKLIENSI